MRILRLSKRIPPCPGGQERHALELTREQAIAGHDVTLLYAAGEAPDDEGWEPARIVPDLGRMPWTVEAIRYSLAARNWLRANRRSYDLVHAHGDFPEALCALALSRRLKCPAMCTIHASFGQRRWLWDALRRYAFGRLQHVCCVSRNTADELQALGVKTPVTVQHSGTRVAPLREIPRDTSPPPRLVAVGRLAPLKGFSYLLEATRELLQEWPDLQVDILGDGELRDELRAAAADLPGVTFHGGVDRDTVYRHLRRASIFVLPSVDLPTIREGLPTTVIEALAAGVPVVATDVAGVPEVVKHEENGLLVQQGDAAALTAAIARLLREPELAARLSSTEVAQSDKFDWREVAKVFTRVGEGLVNGG